MSARPRYVAAAVVFLLGLARSGVAHACSATETQVYQSATTVWCVDTGIVTKYGAFPSAYFSYGDDVIQELVSLFDVPAQGVYTFEAGPATGSAHTGSECCGLGVTVTGDAFYGNAYGATGFWGYLLSLHETINDWTGQVSGGWPTDFWADHVSAFPNSMDWQIMAALGAKLGDANLTAASAGQKARFYPGGDSVDPRVPMFDGIFAMPKMGFPGWSRIFSYVEGDKVSWDGLGVANPSELRTEYVTAYVSLGPGVSVLPQMVMANVANGTDDGAGDSDPTYTAKESVVDAVATAHCAIAAAAAQGADESADLKALQSGSYASVAAKGKCGAGCPSECGCATSSGLCVAPWLADAASDGGAKNADGGIADAGARDATLGGGGSMGSDGGSPGALDEGGSGSPGGVVPVGDDGGANGAATGDSGGAVGCACSAAGAGGSGGAWLLPLCGLVAIGLMSVRARRR